MLQEYIHWDATTMAEKVRNGEVEPIELVDAAIARIEVVNPRVNAVVAHWFEESREAAKGPLPDGPFRGVPFLLKDLLAPLAGKIMTAGSRYLKNFIPDHDSEIVRRFKAAGLIILGRTSTPEFGIQPTTEPLLFGPARNPWNLARSTGGSSGGSAAAVASRMVPAAHGNDGGGSIRIPSSCCGVFGVKPTRGRNSLAPDFGDILSGLITENVITRSVRDSAAFLDISSGPVPGDPYMAPPPPRPYLTEVGRDPGSLKIAFTLQSALGGVVEPDCHTAITETVKLLQQLGHQVEERDLDLQIDTLVPAFIVIWTTGVASAVVNTIDLIGREPEEDEFEPLTRYLWEVGRQHHGVGYLKSIAEIQRQTRQVAQQFETYDIWLTPTLAKPPIPIGELDFQPDDPLKAFMLGAEFSPFCALCNVTGQPAMSVPLYWNSVGLPIGSHFISRFGDEGALFRLAAQLEAARPWVDRLPDL